MAHISYNKLQILALRRYQRINKLCWGLTKAEEECSSPMVFMDLLYGVRDQFIKSINLFVLLSACQVCRLRR